MALCNGKENRHSLKCRLPLCFQDGSAKFLQNQEILFQSARYIQGRNIQLEVFLINLSLACVAFGTAHQDTVFPPPAEKLVTVLPVFNVCFSNTAAKISFHKRALVTIQTFFSSFFIQPIFSLKHAFSYTSTMQEGVPLPRSDEIRTQNDTKGI